MKNTLLATLAGLGSATAIALLAYADSVQPELTLIMAPFGATAVLVFGLPNSPLAQPKNVIFGHLITAFIGVLFSSFFAITPLTLSLATGIAVSAMILTKTTHPPAGANPLLIMLTGQSWVFLLTPVLTGAIAMTVVGKVVAKIRTQLETRFE
jgi:CBS-domain-containing membrane protein